MRQQYFDRWMVTVALLVSLGTATSAQAEDPWRLRLGAASATSVSGGGSTGDLGYGASLEYTPWDRLGIELTAMDLDVESEVDFEFGPSSTTLTSDVGIRPVLLSLNVHVARSERFDLFLGPVAGYASLDDLRVTVGIDGEDEEVARVPLEDTAVFGGRLGFDLNLGDGASLLTGGVTYLRVPLDTAGTQGNDDGDTGDLDTVVVQLGLGFRF